MEFAFVKFTLFTYVYSNSIIYASHCLSLMYNQTRVLQKKFNPSKSKLDSPFVVSRVRNHIKSLFSEIVRNHTQMCLSVTSAKHWILTACDVTLRNTRPTAEHH